MAEKDLHPCAPEDLLHLIVDNHNSGRWLNSTIPVQTKEGVKKVGVKAFGKWVQRVECNSVVTSTVEVKTKKLFAEVAQKALQEVGLEFVWSK